MDLKKTIVSFMAAGAVLAGGFAGAVAEQADGDTQTLTVQVTANGKFDVKFCGDADGNFGPRTLNSTNHGKEPLSTNVTICYDDTLVYRDAFNAYLSADDFEGKIDGNEISAENLTLGHLSIMNSGQWDGKDGPIGEISGLTGNSTQSINTHDGATWVGDSLDSPQHVHLGYAGVGTGGTKYLDDEFDFPQDDRSEAGSWQEMELLLTVPHDTASDDYTSTLTIEVNFAGTP